MIMGLSPDVFWSIIAVLVFVFISSITWYKGRMKEVLMIISYMVQVAEDKFGSGTGALKYDFVVTSIYAVLPPVVKFFLTDKQLDVLIENAVDALQAGLLYEIEHLKIKDKNKNKGA